MLGFVKRPTLMRLLQRGAEAHLRRQVNDPELRRKLTPDYTIGCKRILISNDYYPALTAARTSTSSPRAWPRSAAARVVGTDGGEREVDAIILGTGFHVTDSPAMRVIHGRDGRSLAERWDGSPRRTAARPSPASRTCS